MPCDHVADLVAYDRREFGIILGHLHEPGVNANLASRQRKRIQVR